MILNGLGLTATDDELEILTLELASGKLSKEGVVNFYLEKVVDP